MSYLSRLLLICASLSLSLSLLAACGSKSESRKNDIDLMGPQIQTGKTADGLVVEYLDADGDGQPDIIRYFEEFEDPRDPQRTRRRLRRMEIDANTDGKINVRRHYDEFGNVQREENDMNLDGEMDSIIYFVGGERARKELYDTETGQIIERRIYYDGALVRVEKDLNRNGNVDSWEYYEDGILMRIGRDTVGDGAADTWQLR